MDRAHGTGLCVEQSKYRAMLARAEQAEAELLQVTQFYTRTNEQLNEALTELERLRAGIREALRLFQEQGWISAEQFLLAVGEPDA